MSSYQYVPHETANGRFVETVNATIAHRDAEIAQLTEELEKLKKTVAAQADALAATAKATAATPVSAEPPEDPKPRMIAMDNEDANAATVIALRFLSCCVESRHAVVGLMVTTLMTIIGICDAYQRAHHHLWLSIIICTAAFLWFGSDVSATLKPLWMDFWTSSAERATPNLRKLAKVTVEAVLELVAFASAMWLCAYLLYTECHTNSLRQTILCHATNST